MSRPWWGKDVPAARAVEAADADAAQGALLPPIVTTDAKAIAAELHDRRAGFTPQWTSRRTDDPGNALVDVYAELHATVAGLVAELPLKARVEELVDAGVVSAPPRPLAAMLAFEVSESAPTSVVIGERFEVLGRDTDGKLVTFETDRELVAVAAKLAQLGARNGGSISALTLPTPPEVVYPFGLAPAAGTALYLGLAATIPPAPKLAIGFSLAPLDGAPPPASAGGLMPAPGAEPPTLVWERLDRGSFVPAALLRDETKQFTQSGVIELQLPNDWRPGTPPGADPGEPMYWVRCQLQTGAWPRPPAVDSIAINVVPASSGRTIRDELIDTPIEIDPRKRRVLTLAASPVLAGSLIIDIDEGSGTLVRWNPVDDLAQAAFDDRVFRFDPNTGTLTFGDGRNGRPLPDGFRHVHATYRVAETATSVAAGAISIASGEAPFLSSVTNAQPASGGGGPELLPATLLRGPRAIRARGRAVANADYEVLALGAAGADIRRARAVGGLHPRFPGARIAGAVGVFVVGAARDDGRPPIPTEATLEAVSAALSAIAPRGAEVIAVAPVFHRIRIEATFELADGVDATTTLYTAGARIDRWFDPVAGSASGEGWPFGGTIRYDALVRFLLHELAGKVIAIPRLLFVVDGVRSGHCADVALPANELLWPAPHELVALPRRRP